MSEGPKHINVTWWLDASALPERLLWARLEQLPAEAVVKDCDGNVHRFQDVDQARLWLLEDEYEQLSNLLSDGNLAPGTSPPSDDF
jgi:hypothetical protein